MTITATQRLSAEFLGRFWLVFGGCGSAVLGAIAAAGLLYLIASGKPGFELGGFASNGYGDFSPGKYSLAACLVCAFL